MRKIHNAVAALCGTLMMAGSMTAMADSTDDIVRALISKGVLTEEEGALLMKGRAGEKEAAEKAAKDNATVKMGKKGLEIASGDGNFTMKVGGRMHADWTYHDGDSDLRRGGGPIEATDGTDIRRARISISGTILKDFEYMIEPEFAGSGGFRDLFLTYTGFENIELTAGHQKHAMSMEIQESSNDIMFTERSLLQALTIPFFDRAVGVNAKAFGEIWNVQGGIYGDSFTSNSSNEREGSGWAVRGTVAPINSDTRVIHLGVNLGEREANADGEPNSSTSTARLRNETTNMSDLFLTDTGSGNLDDFNKMKLGILEAAAMYGPFSVQSEFAKGRVERDNGSDLDFDGFYVQAGWTLTGESRTYKATDGEFKRLKPKNPFDLDKGTWGAWEVAARYDQIDLEDEDIMGGEQKRATLALNWYLNENVRLMADYYRTFDLENSPITTSSGDDPDSIDVFNIRAQWAF